MGSEGVGRVVGVAGAEILSGYRTGSRIIVYMETGRGSAEWARLHAEVGSTMEGTAADHKGKKGGANGHMGVRHTSGHDKGRGANAERWAKRIDRDLVGQFEHAKAVGPQPRTVPGLGCFVSVVVSRGLAKLG